MKNIIIDTIFGLIMAAFGAFVFYHNQTKPLPAPASANVSSTGAATPRPSDDGKGDLSQRMADGQASAVAPEAKAEPGMLLVDSRPSGEVPLSAARTQPAHDPLPAPARVYAPAAPSGHYENYGLFGRKTRWVSNQPAYQPRQQTFGGCSGPGCGGRR